ncbi:MAG: 30S ribosomal protein S20 [Candidatus Omnitrophica bacterium]|nr:30S ribosomal protein S20 [Candidatus Omnitrophota bacterium]
MPIKRSSFKDLRKSRARHVRNISTMSEIRTLAKKFESLIIEKKVKEAGAALSKFASKMDKAAKKGVIKKNTSARKISRFMKRLAVLGKA